MITDEDRETVEYDNDLYFEFENTYVDGRPYEDLYISYDALIRDADIDSLRGYDDYLDNNSAVSTEIWNELAGKVIEVLDSDNGYATEIRVHYEWAAPIVADDSSLDLSWTLLNPEWDNFNRTGFNTGADTTYVMIYEEYNSNTNPTRVTGYDVDVCDVDDIIEWTDNDPDTDKDGRATLVNVVKDDDGEAQLVYVYNFDPDYHYRTVTINVNDKQYFTTNEDNNYYLFCQARQVDVNGAIGAFEEAMEAAGFESGKNKFTYSVEGYEDEGYTGALIDSTVIAIPTGHDDLVINITATNEDIATDPDTGLILDVTAADDATPADYIDMYSNGTIRYGFKVSAENGAVESVSWLETVVNAYGRTDRYQKTAEVTDLDFIPEENAYLVQATAEGVWNLGDVRIVRVTNATVNTVAPVVDTYTLTIQDNYAGIRNALNFFIDNKDAEDQVKEIKTPDGTYYTLEVPENAEVIVTRDNGTFGNDLYYYNGVVVEKNGNKVIIDSMTNDVVLGNELDTKCAVEAVELVNGVEAKLAANEPETNLVATIGDTLYVKSGTKLTVTVPEDAGTGYLVNVISGTKQASGTDQTISADTKLYAAVNVKQKDVYVYYKDLAGTTQTHNGSDLAVGTELTFSLDMGATKNYYGTSVIDTKNGNAVLEDGVKVGTKDMAPNGAFTVNFTDMTVTADGKSIESGDKVVNGATLACTVDKNEGTTAIVLNKGSENLGTAYTPGTVTSDLNLTAGVKLDVDAGTVTLAGGKAPITGDTTYAVKGTELEVVVDADETVTVNGNEVSTPDGVANITVGNVDMTIDKK